MAHSNLLHTRKFYQILFCLFIKLINAFVFPDPEPLIIKIYANSFCKSNQKVCIDCLNPRSNKNKFECKNYGCIDFCVLDYQDYLFQIIYKMAVLSKVKPRSDTVDYFKELLFYNKLIKKPKAKRLKTLID